MPRRSSTRATGRRAPSPARHRAGPSRPGAAGTVLLAWALDRDGARVRASSLDARSRRARAPFTCLACQEPLVPHLGRVRTPHFAHAAGSACPLTAPETALHLDAKERLLALCAEAFAGRRRVTLLARCPSCRLPALRELAAAGDAAVAEGAVGPLRADVLVLRRGRPALALEVRVTHAVEAGKEAALEAAGVPALEVDAREEWERVEEGGTAIVCARSFGLAPCAACAARARAEAERGRGGEAAEIAELEAYRARGLLGPGVARSGEPDAAAGERPLSARERTAVARRFRCPDCGGTALTGGERLLRHRCPARGDRPVAWRGYEGRVVELGWWRRAEGGPAPGPK